MKFEGWWMVMVVGLLAGGLAVAQEDRAGAVSEDALGPAFERLGIPDGRRERLREDVEVLRAADEVPALAVARAREFLAEHGFHDSDLGWLDRVAGIEDESLRRALLVANAGRLLRDGPPELDGHWPEWDAGETPGERRLEKPAEAAADADGEEALEAFVPKNRIYRMLLDRYRGMLADLQQLNEKFAPLPPIEEGEIVQAGETYQGASQLARRLAEEGLLEDAEQAAGNETGIFTAELSAAIERLQQRHGLKTDGILGPNTLGLLNRSPEEELELLRINLHRARLLPDDFGPRHILVNVPSSELAAFSEPDQPQITMKVIVGAANRERETPVFRDVMETVEFAPYWNVPVSIARDEIVPKARGDHGYLPRNDYEIVESYGASSSRAVTSGTLSAVEGGELFIRQTPGEANALGRVKFLFPNDYAIYLHDTPKDRLFGESQRDFSHGCIRVEDPAGLASFVLGPQGWTEGEIREALSAEETKPVEVERAVNVFIVYFTAWPDWDGQGGIRFHPDLYGLDPQLLDSGK